MMAQVKLEKHLLKNFSDQELKDEMSRLNWISDPIPSEIARLRAIIEIQRERKGKMSESSE
jgi:hypothetical protein